MELQAVYVEDVPAQGTKYSDLLNEKGKLHVEWIMAPVPMSVKPVIEKKPDIILVDYELTQRQPGGLMASYKGGTLATSIREVYPNCPIVLVTRMVLLKKYSGAPRQLGPFDLRFFKDEIRENPKLCVDKLVAIASGYRKLRESKPLTWSRILNLLDANSLESEALKQFKPSGQVLVGKKGQRVNWSIPDVATWILDTLFEYPGILYDDLHAATALGMSLDSLARKEVLSTLSPALYNGIFSSSVRKWWRDRILSEGFRTIKGAHLDPPLASAFVPAMKLIKDVQLQSSTCVYSGKPFADTVCYVLRQPVLRDYSLAYFPDNRPKVMDEARVSFAAFRSSEFHEEFLNSESREIFRKLTGVGKHKRR
jgi:hypothetical protein